MVLLFLRRLLRLLDKHADENELDSIPLFFPPISLCTDNGVMVAWAGIETLQLGISNDIDGQEVVPKWSIAAPAVDRPGVLHKARKLAAKMKAQVAKAQRGNQSQS